MNNIKKVCLGTASAEITEKKSRFIGTVREARTEADALRSLEELRKKYWDARHNCYAYESQGILRFSDDGEPQGTAGKPILEVIEGLPLSNTIIVVTRYFGGVLLGTGGLVRAYTKAAQEAVSAAKILDLYEGSRVEISCDYSALGKIRYLLPQMEIPVLSTEYTDRVLFSLAVTEDKIGLLSKKVTEATGASAQISILESLSFCNDAGRVILY